MDTALSELRGFIVEEGIPRVGELLTNTVQLVVVVTAASLLVGAAAAWLTERTDLAGVRAWRVALVLPIAVPEILLSGHHARIDAWREMQRQIRTRQRRPDLWARHLAGRKDPLGDA